MFKNSSLLAWCKSDNKSLSICRIEIEQSAQISICNNFEKYFVEYFSDDKERVVFDGSYKPEVNEYLAIENFNIDEEIKNALKSPLGVPAFSKNNNKYPEIIALFIGQYDRNNDSYNIAFQKFKSSQYISTKMMHLFFDSNTFREEKRFGISVALALDCIYTNNELRFISYYFARQIFDLNKYYRHATDKEVTCFIQNKYLAIEDESLFYEHADSWIRRKIAMINDSGVLKDISVNRIKSKGKTVGLNVNIENGKILLPRDKKELKKILGFLDEEVYKGPFSQTSYIANSKRKI